MIIPSYQSQDNTNINDNRAPNMSRCFWEPPGDWRPAYKMETTTSTFRSLGLFLVDGCECLFEHQGWTDSGNHSALTWGRGLASISWVFGCCPRHIRPVFDVLVGVYRNSITACQSAKWGVKEFGVNVGNAAPALYQITLTDLNQLF